MNKWEKIASKMAKEDIEKMPFLTHRDFNKLKKEYLKSFKDHNYDVQKALEFKKWTKTLKSFL